MCGSRCVKMPCRSVASADQTRISIGCGRTCQFSALPWRVGFAFAETWLLWSLTRPRAGTIRSTRQLKVIRGSPSLEERIFWGSDSRCCCREHTICGLVRTCGLLTTVGEHHEINARVCAFHGGSSGTLGSYLHISEQNEADTYKHNISR